MERKTFKKQSRKQKIGNPEQYEVYRLMGNHPERYPLKDECFYVGKVAGKHTGRLERGHLDYKNKGFNYVTVCRKCNLAMDKDSKMMKLAWDYIKGLARRK